MNIEVIEKDARGWVERKSMNQKQIPSVNEGNEEVYKMTAARWGKDINHFLRKEEIIGPREVLNWK